MKTYELSSKNLFSKVLSYKINAYFAMEVLKFVRDFVTNMVFPQLWKPGAQSQLGTICQPRTVHGVSIINKDFSTDFTLFQTTLSVVIGTCFRFISHVTNGICVVLSYSCAILQNAHKHLNDALQPHQKESWRQPSYFLQTMKNGTYWARCCCELFILYASNNRAWLNRNIGGKAHLFGHSTRAELSN